MMNYTISKDSSSPFFKKGTTAFSMEADYVDQKRKEFDERLHTSENFGSRMHQIITLINSSLSPCINKNRDGYGALPVGFETYRKALEFLFSLPLSVSLPDISVDPDGSVSCEWYRSPDWLFSVSIDAEGKLDYAAIYKDKKYYGSTFFSGEADICILNMIGMVNG